MDETKPAEQEHKHWWQIAPYEWLEEALSPTTKCLVVVRFIRHCAGCGLAIVVKGTETD